MLGGTPRALSTLNLGSGSTDRDLSRDFFAQGACKMGLEGIVSKRLARATGQAASPDWLKFENPVGAPGEAGGGGGLGQVTVISRAQGSL
jgi:hypothetical protein